jgi:hypothetical protein
LFTLANRCCNWLHVDVVFALNRVQGVGMRPVVTLGSVYFGGRGGVRGDAEARCRPRERRGWTDSFFRNLHRASASLLRRFRQSDVFVVR